MRGCSIVSASACARVLLGEGRVWIPSRHASNCLHPFSLVQYPDFTETPIISYYFPGETFRWEEILRKVCPTVGMFTCFFPLWSLTQRNAALTQLAARKEATPDGGILPWHGRNWRQKACVLCQGSDTALTNWGPVTPPGVPLRKKTTEEEEWGRSKNSGTSSVDHVLKPMEMTKPLSKWQWDAWVTYSSKRHSALFLLGFNYRSHGYFLLTSSFIMKKTPKVQNIYFF